MKKPQLLITGAGGLVGGHLAGSLGHAFEILAPDRSTLDITNAESVDAYFTGIYPVAIIHCAAFTDNTAAEKERGDRNGLCFRTNVTGTANVVRAAAKSGVFVIFFSTGSVFAGSAPGVVYGEGSGTGTQGELSWYGWTKKLAEEEIGFGAVVRLSRPVIPTAPVDGKKDYTGNLISLYDRKELFPLFTDVEFPLTSGADLTATVRKLIAVQKKGIYHPVSRDAVSPYDLARYVLKKKYGETPAVTKTTYSEFIRSQSIPLRYAGGGVLSGRLTHEMLGTPEYSWTEALDPIQWE
jgi:dTDP-4-dehydrorhamnose reductase